MPCDDIYGNKQNYERLVTTLELLTRPIPSGERRGVRKYQCRNPDNLRHFRTMHRIFERKDISYVRRLRVLRNLLLVVHHTEKDLQECTREDIDTIVIASHRANRSPKSKECFITDLKHLWRCLFPEEDERGRIDETVMPYTVRHLSARVDRSQNRLRNDRLTWAEYEQLVAYFCADPQMQCYITLAVESLGRPQELCYRRVGDVEMHDHYARIWVTDHGKEGTKALQCIDSFPYLLKWYEQHPYQHHDDAFLFFAQGRKDVPQKPGWLNKKLTIACRRLGITKNITPYSLKRNGVTFGRLRGDADVDIQHRAGWTSTKQLKTYDLSTSEDVFKRELAKRGLITDDEYAHLLPKTKHCLCGAVVGFTDKLCFRCKRVMDRPAAKDVEAEREMREVLSLALEHPTMSFVDLMEKWRSGQRASPE